MLVTVRLYFATLQVLLANDVASVKFDQNHVFSCEDISFTIVECFDFKR